MKTFMNNKRLGLVHLAKTRVGMSDTEYRDLLSGVGAESSKNLTPDTFEAVMDRFRKLGFKSDFSQRARKRPAADKAPLMGKIGAILADMKLPWSYADGIARKRFKKQAVQWCNPNELYKIAQMLAVHQQRHDKSKGVTNERA